MGGWTIGAQLIFANWNWSLIKGRQRYLFHFFNNYLQFSVGLDEQCFSHPQWIYKSTNVSKHLGRVSVFPSTVWFSRIERRKIHGMNNKLIKIPSAGPWLLVISFIAICCFLCKSCQEMNTKEKSTNNWIIKKKNSFFILFFLPAASLLLLLQIPHLFWM